jgi:hypothetical protein
MQHHKFIPHETYVDTHVNTSIPTYTVNGTTITDRDTKRTIRVPVSVGWAENGVTKEDEGKPIEVNIPEMYPENKVPPPAKKKVPFWQDFVNKVRRSDANHYQSWGDVKKSYKNKP